MKSMPDERATMNTTSADGRVCEGEYRDGGLTPTWCVDAEGGLDLVRLLEASQDFFRRHSGHWKKRFP